jgi:hypothetical protein
MPSTKLAKKTSSKTVVAKGKKVVKKTAEPIPDDNAEAESEEVKTEFETWDEVEKACKENEAEITICNKRRKQLDAIKKTMFTKMKKEAGKKMRKKRNPDGTVQNSGVTKKIGMPPKFLKFVNDGTENGLFSEEVQAVIDAAEYDEDSHIARNTITKIIYDYIKFSELYDTKENGEYDRKAIMPDKTIKTLFALKKGDVLIFDTFQTFVSTLAKTAPSIEPEVPVKTGKKATTKKAVKKVAKKKAEPVVEEEEEWEEEEGEEEGEEEEYEYE